MSFILKSELIELNKILCNHMLKFVTDIKFGQYKPIFCMLHVPIYYHVITQ
jgi:hypothetical protein